MTAAHPSVAERMAEVAALDLRWLRRRAERRFAVLADLAHTPRAEREARAARVEAWLAEDERNAEGRLAYYVHQQLPDQEESDHE